MTCLLLAAAYVGVGVWLFRYTDSYVEVTPLDLALIVLWPVMLIGLMIASIVAAVKWLSDS